MSKGVCCACPRKGTFACGVLLLQVGCERLSMAAHLVAGYGEARLPLRPEPLCQAHPGSAASAIKPQGFKKAGARCVLPLMTL